jgi:hypothetical protein
MVNCLSGINQGVFELSSVKSAAPQEAIDSFEKEQSYFVELGTE